MKYTRDASLVKTVTMATKTKKKKKMKTMMIKLLQEKNKANVRHNVAYTHRAQIFMFSIAVIL